MPGKILVDITPLRDSRDFRLLFTGQLISMLGSQLTVVAIPYQIYQMTHSSLQVGAVSLAQLLPFIAGALVAGPMGDSHDRRRIMLWTAAGLLLTSAALAYNASVAHPSLLAIYLVSAVAAALNGFSNTARMASVPGLVERRHISAAAAMMQVTFQVGAVVGPALSGLLLGIGLPFVYGIDAGTFLVVMVATFMMRPIPPAEGAGLAPVGVDQGGHPLSAQPPGAPRGLHHRHQRHGLRHAASAVPGHGRLGVRGRHHHTGLPLRRTGRRRADRCGDHRLGRQPEAPGSGRHRRRHGVGGRHRIFGLVDTLWVALVLLAIAGWADVISAVLRNTILQSSIPDRFRSRMSSIQMAVVQGGPASR